MIKITIECDKLEDAYKLMNSDVKQAVQMAVKGKPKQIAADERLAIEAETKRMVRRYNKKGKPSIKQQVKAILKQNPNKYSINRIGEKFYPSGEGTNYYKMKGIIEHLNLMHLVKQRKVR